MKLLIKRVEGLILPKKANACDAAFDIYATTDPIIVSDPEDTLAPLPLEEFPTLYRKVKHIEFGTNLFWTPAEHLDITTVKQKTNKVISKERLTVPNLGWHIELFPRSSISKYSLVLANSVPTIDTGYQNEVRLKFFYLFQPKDLRPHRNGNGDYEIVGKIDLDSVYKRGDRIAQMKPRANVDIEFEIVDELPSVDTRKMGGFGSSGS